MSELFALPGSILDLIIESMFDKIDIERTDGVTMASLAKTCSQARNALARNHIRWCKAVVYSRLLVGEPISKISTSSINTTGTTTEFTWRTKVAPREKDLPNPKLANESLIYCASTIIMECTIMSSALPDQAFPVIHLRPNIPISDRTKQNEHKYADFYKIFDAAAKTADTKKTRIVCIKIDLQLNTIEQCTEPTCPYFDKHVVPMPQLPILATAFRFMGPNELVDPSSTRITKSATIIISWKIGEPDLRIFPTDQI